MLKLIFKPPQCFSPHSQSFQFQTTHEITCRLKAFIVFPAWYIGETDCFVKISPSNYKRLLRSGLRHSSEAEHHQIEHQILL